MAVVRFEDEVAEALGRDGDPAFAGLDDAAVEQSLRIAASEVAASQCRFLELLAELTVRGIWSDQGARTPAEWLSWAISMAPSTAREQVRVALRLHRFPATVEAFREGRLSYSKVRAITRIDEPALEPMLLRFSEHATAAQLERIVADYRAAQEAHASPAGPAPEDLREVSFRPTGRGTVRIVLEAPAEDVWAAQAALRDQAVRAWRDARRAAESDSAEADKIPLSAWMAQAALDAIHARTVDGPTDVSGADRQLLVIHCDAEDLTDPGEGLDRTVPIEIRTGARRSHRAMSVRMLRRLACDAKLAVVGESDRAHDAVSGTTRAVPSRLRRRLIARDKSCRFPSCHATIGLDAHHIVHVADGGETTLENLALLCRFHHRFVHDAGWELLTDGNGHFRFQPPDRPPLPTAGTLPGASAESAPGSHPETLQPSWDGTRPDYHMCVVALEDELARLRAPEAAAA